MNKNVVIFGDNKKICHKLISMLRETGVCAEMPILASRYLCRDISRIAHVASGKQILLVLKNEDLKKATEILHENGLADLYVCPWDTHFIDKDDVTLNSCVFQIDNSKPRLNQVEIELSESCNLNCKGCFQFSNLVKNEKFSDLKVFENDLEQLKKIFWGIGKIKLLGGEPLLNPNFLLYIKKAREIFPDSDIRLVSNGLLIPKLSRAALEEIKNNNCTVDISNYPPTRKRLDSIIDSLKKAGVSYTVSLPINMFFKALLPKPARSPNAAFNNCIFTHCHALANGNLGACTHQFYISRLNTAFDLDYPEEGKNEVIDIYHTALNGWEINNIFEQPHDFCRYCSTGMVPFKWKPAPKSKAKANDWIVKSTFINGKMLPVFQKTMKSFEKRLRHFMQQPKSNRRKF